jgi:hypothetical protein
VKSAGNIVAARISGQSQVGAPGRDCRWVAPRASMRRRLVGTWSGGPAVPFQGGRVAISDKKPRHVRTICRSTFCWRANLQSECFHVWKTDGAASCRYATRPVLSDQRSSRRCPAGPPDLTCLRQHPTALPSAPPRPMHEMRLPGSPLGVCAKSFPGYTLTRAMDAILRLRSPSG